jgi:hypothetical protein
MPNPPGLSVNVGGTELVAGVTQGIMFEMFNSTDETMQVYLNAVSVWLAPSSGTSFQPSVPVPPNVLTPGFFKAPPGEYNAIVQPVGGPPYTVATDVAVGIELNFEGGGVPSEPPGHEHLPFGIHPEQGQPNPMT